MAPTCPENTTPQEYNIHYGGTCIPNNENNNSSNNSNNTFNIDTISEYKVIYNDGTSEYIYLQNREYSINNNTYQLTNTTPITIIWPNSDPPVIQVLNTTDNSNNITWTTNSTDNKYTKIIWEPVEINVI